MFNAMDKTYPHYNPQGPLDALKDARERYSFNKTLETIHYDPTKEEDVSVEKIVSLQYEITSTEEDEVLNSFNTQYPIGNYSTNFPHRKVPVNLFYYNPYVDLSDYKSEFPKQGMISPKKHRLEYFTKNMNGMLMELFERRYNNPKNFDRNLFIIPGIDKSNEELADKVRVRSNRERYLQRIETTTMEQKIQEFLDSQTDTDVAQVTDDEMDQALFEAQYTKPTKDSKPYKSKY